MKGKISYQVCEDAIPRLTTTTNPEDLADCDLIIEVRNPKHKQASQTGLTYISARAEPAAPVASFATG